MTSDVYWREGETMEPDLGPVTMGEFLVNLMCYGTAASLFIGVFVWYLTHA